MKKGIILVIWMISLCGQSCINRNQHHGGTFVPDADYIQIVLFHMEQRCESCNAVEEVTRLLLDEEYQEEVNLGKVKFISMNFQSENGKKAANLLQATGQTLFVVKGDSISNLTSAAFMYASTHPEYYRESLRKALDKYLE